MRWIHAPTLVRTGAAVAATAVAGSLAVHPRDSWYVSLEKPPWQPPAQSFGLVWTPLYALIAIASARALDAAPDRRARRVTAGVLTADLVMNAGWTWVFFGARRPAAALAELAGLHAANLALLWRAWRADRVAGALLVPYLAWTGFATALNASIVRRNPDR